MKKPLKLMLFIIFFLAVLYGFGSFLEYNLTISQWTRVTRGSFGALFLIASILAACVILVDTSATSSGRAKVYKNNGQKFFSYFMLTLMMVLITGTILYTYGSFMEYNFSIGQWHPASRIFLGIIELFILIGVSIANATDYDYL